MNGLPRCVRQRDASSSSRTIDCGVSVRVRHFGNTANNAYYNALLLQQFEGIESDLPIRSFGLQHAISAPAWEGLEFVVPDAEWVARPDWATIAGALDFNSEYTDFKDPDGPDAAAPSKPNVKGVAMSVARAALNPLYGRRWAQPIFNLSYRLILARRPTLPSLEGRIDLMYGANSLIRLRVAQPSPHLVCLEHGTVRWIGDGNREEKTLRFAYRDQVKQARHLWVTNLDPRTLEIAEDVAPGRWTALPHPFVPDRRVPFSASEVQREQLLRLTKSESLVLLPASQNWSKHHDKGSMKALLAFVELRRKGIDVGLVAVEWGLQLAESKAYLNDAGVGENVTWVPPMARFTLQRMMANVDLVWDQFGLDAFGALALRAVEQGTPLVSRGLAPIGERLIGGPVPWKQASTTDEIVYETAGILEQMGLHGRDEVIRRTRESYRAWLFSRHSPAMTAALQRDVYEALLLGHSRSGTASPDAWSKCLPSGRQEETGELT